MSSDFYWSSKISAWCFMYDCGSSWGIRTLSVYYIRLRRLLQTDAAPMMCIMIADCRQSLCASVFLHELRLWLGCGWRLKSTMNNKSHISACTPIKNQKFANMVLLSCCLVLTCAWSCAEALRPASAFLEVIEISSLLFSHRVASPYLCHTRCLGVLHFALQTGSYRAGKPISLQHFVHTVFQTFGGSESHNKGVLSSEWIFNGSVTQAVIESKQS